MSDKPIEKSEAAVTTPPSRGEWFDRFTSWPERFSDMFRSNWTAMAESEFRVEEKVEGGSYVVRADLPGIDPDKDVHITCANGRVEIRAERRSEVKEDKEGMHRSEIRYGSFLRSLPLPAGADSDDVKATYTDGVLEVRMPMSEGKAGPTRIPVTRGLT